ncbi:MAG: adenylate/guanylate cyclase domain-containing protein, partial [Acidimicrobiia bacterium]
MPRARPGGTVTFLFTDIEDSTRRWEEDPSDMADALRVHDAILRGAIDRHGGYVFGTGGDGFCAAFSTAADAAAAAVESQDELRDDSTVDFVVRMGLHTGEAIERDQNYFGSEVNRAARLMSIAHGGQVLVSDATEVLLRDRVALRPLGEHRLRGLRGRMSVYQVIAEGLRADFPVLRSVDAVTGNLPRQLSTVIGRDAVVGELAELLREHRLVTLTGVGGVGKTRLAVEVAAEVAGEFPDGVWLIELASVSDPNSVPAAVATVLGITPQGDTPLVQTVAETLAGRQLLLVVDNCEHLRDGAASTIASILGRSGRARIVATSREALAVAGESALAVPPLAREGGVASDAVALFVDRARAVRPDFGLTDGQTADAVTEICETVDGLPLGIELAAARMAAMSAVEVRDRLADRFRLLQGATPGPERQL